MIILTLAGLLIIIILGAGAGAYVTVHIIADMPPPEAARKVAWLIPAGGVGGLIGGLIFQATLSDPMPGRGIVGLAAVVSLGLIASTVTAVAAGFAKKSQAVR